MGPLLILLAAAPPKLSDNVGTWRSLVNCPSLNVPGPVFPATPQNAKFHDHWLKYLKARGIPINYPTKQPPIAPDGFNGVSMPPPLLSVGEWEDPGHYWFEIHLKAYLPLGPGPHYISFKALSPKNSTPATVWCRKILAHTHAQRDRLIDKYLQIFVDDWNRSHGGFRLTRPK